MLYNTIREIKEELKSCENIEMMKVKNHQMTLVIEAKEFSCLVDKHDNKFDLAVFDNIDYEVVSDYKNISGFEVVKFIKNIGL